jgi:HK97 gp10 family phage protein
MSEYNDGLTESLGKYFTELGKVGDLAIESIKEQIDIEAEAVEKSLRDNTPHKTGGLKESLRKTKIDSRNNRYGYRLEYEGNDPDGTPYAKIANILNSGTSKIKPRRFITKAVRKLRGLDDRAANRFEGKLKP